MRGIGFGPDFDDRDDLGRGHVGERLVVLGGEGQDVAAAGGRLSAEQRGSKVWELRVNSSPAVCSNRLDVPEDDSCLYSACSSLTAL